MMENTSKPCVVFVRESLKQSIISDLKTVFLLCTSIGVGVVLESQAMQWVGGLIFISWIFCSASNAKYRMTPQQAADKLKSEFGVIGK